MIRDAAPRDVPLYLTARFIGTIGMQMQSVAIGWQVYEATGRALDLGLVGLAQFVPAIGLALVTGDVADRVDRRRILLVCHVAFAICSALLFLLARRDPSDVLPIYAVLVLLGATRAFGAPASHALLPHLVPPARLQRAVALNSTIWQVGTVAGPALGGLVYDLAGGAVYAIAAGCSLTAFFLLLSMHVRLGPMSTAARSWERVLAGVRFVRSKPIVLGAISLDLFAVLLGGAEALLPVYARDILHVDAVGLGLLRAAPAAGAAVLAIALARWPLQRNVGVTMLTCVTVFGLATIVFGLSTWFPISLAALFVLGASDMVSVVIRHTLVQTATPPEMRGRVSAVNLMFINTSNELGQFESGATAALFGTVPAVVIGGVGTLAVVGVWAWAFPVLRKVDRIEDAPVL